MTKYLYCFIRKDISIEQQIVQMSHAAFEAGVCFGAGCEVPPHICLFEVKDQAELMITGLRLEDAEIPLKSFWEPDNGMGLSAICTGPIESEEQRAMFSRYTMYKAENG